MDFRESTFAGAGNESRMKCLEVCAWVSDGAVVLLVKWSATYCFLAHMSESGVVYYTTANSSDIESKLMRKYSRDLKFSARVRQEAVSTWFALRAAYIYLDTCMWKLSRSNRMWIVQGISSRFQSSSGELLRT